MEDEITHEDGSESIDGIEVEENFFSDPFFYDPVIPAGAKVAFDVQGAQGKRLPYDYCVMIILFS
jgi:hypothetical protein